MIFTPPSRFPLPVISPGARTGRNPAPPGVLGPPEAPSGAPPSPSEPGADSQAHVQAIAPPSSTNTTSYRSIMGMMTASSSFFQRSPS